MDITKRDKIFSRLLILVILIVLLPWVWDGLVWSWDWYQGLDGASTNIWAETGRFIWTNLSVFLIAYTIICLQVAGLAEFKFNRNFLPALLLALIITPPVMMATYGRHHKAP